MNTDFQNLLDEAVRFHGHLCGGQVLGVRMAIAGLRELGIKDPRGQEGRDLVLFFEIDRCIADAIISVTGRTPGKRSVRMMDYGKLAATFTETRSGRAVRVSVKPDSTEKIKRLAQTYIPQKEVQQPDLMAMITIAEEDLLNIQNVVVPMRPQDLPGEPLDMVVCQQCGETVKDMRHVILGGKLLCKPCAQGKDYYTVLNYSPPEAALDG
ncbi:MAG: FmdE family protein [Syntrophobacter sp.]